MKTAKLLCLALMVAVASCLGGCPSPTQQDVAAPVFSPEGKKFSSPIDVEITCDIPGAAIYYTTNGSTPSADNGLVYTGPLELAATTTLKAIAYLDGQASPVTADDFTRQYLLSVAISGLGDVTPAPGLHDAGTTIYLQASPGNGWQFDCWGGHANGASSTTALTMDQDTAVTASFVQEGSDWVLIDGLTVGDGAMFITPTGIPVGTGYTYPTGTSVHLDAVENTGSVFMGYYTSLGVLVSLNYGLDLTLTTDTYVVAMFQDLAPPPLPVPADCVLLAQDGQPLGVISTNTFDSDSLANPYGTYGSRYALYSIWNRYGTYGSAYATYSPYNAYTSTPPLILQNGTVIGYLTKNRFLTPRVDPDDLAVALGRYDALR